MTDLYMRILAPLHEGRSVGEGGSEGQGETRGKKLHGLSVAMTQSVNQNHSTNHQNRLLRLVSLSASRRSTSIVQQHPKAAVITLKTINTLTVSLKTNHSLIVVNSTQ